MSFSSIKNFEAKFINEGCEKIQSFLKLFFSKGEEKLMFFSQERQFIG